MIKFSAIALVLLSMLQCTFDNTINSSVSTGNNSQKLLSNTITKLTISGDSLYMFTDVGYSLASDITNPEELISYENNIYNGGLVTAYKGAEYIYYSYTYTPTFSMNINYYLDGILNDDVIYPIPSHEEAVGVTLEMAEKSDTLYSAKKFSAITYTTKRTQYLSEIDTIKGNVVAFPTAEVTDTNSIFHKNNYLGMVTKKAPNNVIGVKNFNNQILALTWDGLYASTDGDVWIKNKFMEKIAKTCVESSEGKIGENKIFFAMYDNTLNTSWDTLYTGDRTNDGLYVSNDNLETFTYFPKFRGKVVGDESFVHMNSFNEKIIIATSDSIYTGIYDGTAFTWESIAIASTMATAINNVAINETSYFLASDNVGVLYSDDFVSWEYITKDKSVVTDLEEVYAYPTTITTTEKITRFAYSLSTNDLVTISIYDYNGDLVKTIIKDQPRLAGTVTEKSTSLEEDFWDGKNSKGTSVFPGTYNFKISTKNSNLSATGKVIVGVIQ